MGIIVVDTVIYQVNGEFIISVWFMKSIRLVIHIIEIYHKNSIMIFKICKHL